MISKDIITQMKIMVISNKYILSHNTNCNFVVQLIPTESKKNKALTQPWKTRLIN